MSRCDISNDAFKIQYVKLTLKNKILKLKNDLQQKSLDMIELEIHKI